ncbi:MAG: hypothetical protein ACXVEE_14675 [Polyangiales bacterium]
MRWLVAAVVCLGCHSHDEAPAGCPAGTVAIESACVPRVDGCDEKSVPRVSGGCEVVGVKACAEGFSPDGEGGCVPILPPDRCGPGTMALPGETTCSALVDCGTDPYGAPTGDRILRVDAKAAAGGDGSESKPFSSLDDAVAASRDGDVVALAAGKYFSSAYVDRAITIRGRCPSMVSIEGGAGNTSIAIRNVVKLERVAVANSDVGVVAIDAVVELNDVWIHDLTADGVYVQVPSGESNVTLRHSLVERVHDTGFGVYGATGLVERSVIRDVGAAEGTDARGLGVAAESNAGRKKPAKITVRNSLIERCHESGVMIAGSEGTVEATLVRDIDAMVSDNVFGTGISVILDKRIKRPATAELRDLVITNTVLAGIYVENSSAKISGTTVTDIRPSPSDKKLGSGVVASQVGSVEMADSFIARNHHVSVLLTGSARIERTIVRDSSPDDSDTGGIGIAAVRIVGSATPRVDVIDTVVAHAFVSGIAFAGISGSANGCNVLDVKPGTGGFGDGIESQPFLVGSTWVTADVEVTGTSVSHVSRAALAVFGGCSARLGSVTSLCNGLDLVYSDARSNDPSVHSTLGILDDGGGNLCGCGDPLVHCLAQESSLSPIPVTAPAKR